MKELLPIRFEGHMEQGGSTRPWKIITISPYSNEPLEVAYVLKLFKHNHVPQQNSIGKEFLCNYLATEFDLITPECGCVFLNGSFLSTLDNRLLSEYSIKHQGYNFASKLCNDTILYSENMPKSFPIKDYANIFMFDCLTLNTDRGGFRNKPNLLIDDSGFILIDHETTFAFADSLNTKAFDIVINNLTKNIIYPYRYDTHLFYRILKNYRGNKKNIFDESREALRNLNLNAINTYISRLDKFDIKVGSKELINDYLQFCKENSEKFINILLSIIS